MGPQYKIDRDKIARHKKELEVRRRGRSVEESFSQIDKSGDLSTKEKLQRLIELRIGGKEKTDIARARPNREPEPRKPLQYFENVYSLNTRYGKTIIGEGLKIDGETLFYLSRNDGFQNLGLDTTLFLDLETTGLAGGTGTTAFLVGLGYFRGDKFVVAQYFLGDPDAEDRMLRELDRLFEEGGFRSIVTYNGRSFDVPLLETRFILKRQALRIVDWPHLDFLFAARRLWKHKHESCRLFHLAREVVAAERIEDIPGAEIPARYFDYLQTGDFSQIEPILYHNQEDILSLLGLIIVGAGLIKSHEAESSAHGDIAEIDALDLVGVGQLFETAGEVQRSIVYFERAVGAGLHGNIESAIKRKLSLFHKKADEWEKAASLWKDLTTLDQLFAFRELAMYYEHQTCNLVEALQMANEGLLLAQKSCDPLDQDFLKRITRLEAKIQRLLAGEPAKPRKARTKKA